jgi:hypothetical protein
LTRAIDAATSADDAKKAARAAVAKAKSAAEKLKRLGEPFLNGTGRAERLSFDVPTLPLFVHECGLGDSHCQVGPYRQLPSSVSLTMSGS